MKSNLLLAAALVAVGATAQAQTRTVNSGGGADFTTISAAIASFNPEPDALTPNVINITNNAVYDEVFTINVPVTIQGNSASRPILTARINPAGDANDGVLLDVSSGSDGITLRNLIIIHSLTTPPTDDLLRAQATLAVPVVLDNVLLTQNNGSNAPVTLDGLSQADLSTAQIIGDDGADLRGTGAATFTLTDVVISHMSPIATTLGNARDGLVCGANATGGYTIGDGCVFSFNGRLGIQANGQSFSINAPTDPVLVVGNKGFAGIWFAGIQATLRNINGVYVLNTTGENVNAPNTGFGWGIESQNRGTTTFTLSNAIIAGNTGEGLLIGSVGTGNTQLTDVTIANNGREAIEYATGSTGGSVTVTDSILAGNGSSGADQIVKNDTTFTFDVINSAIVTAGSFALTGTGVGGTGSITQASVINADPQFVQTTNFTASDFYDVGSSAYATAASGGTPLVGGADANASVGNWGLY